MNPLYNPANILNRQKGAFGGRDLKFFTATNISKQEYDESVR